jgi:asparagine synthase (glutamine-hydrolysing)
MDAVVAHACTEPHFIYPRAEDVFQRASDITWHQDEPFGSTSIFAQWCVFEEAKRVGVKVMLDGQGADEQLAGYHMAFAYRIAGLLRGGRIDMALATLAARKRDLGTPIVEQLRGVMVALMPEFAAARMRSTYHRIRKGGWLDTPIIHERGNQQSAVHAARSRVGLAPAVDIRSLCVTLTFATNLPMLLHWEDRNSMAHSIEARVPFLDHPLVEFALALGNEHKIKSSETKQVLRRAMNGILPETVIHRRDKLGFATPEQVWFRGPLRGEARDGIEKTLSLYPDLLDAKAVRENTERMLSGNAPVDFSLWRIINLGIWGQRFGVGQ